jgi:hypothetical protein
LPQFRYAAATATSLSLGESMKIVVLFILVCLSALVHDTAAFAQSSAPVWEECHFETQWGYQEAHLEESVETTAKGPLVET